jgi:hypothetical protein
MKNSNYPKAWSRFISQGQDLKKTDYEELVGEFGKLSRWSARFRLAKSFKGLDLGDDYSGSDTPQLYSAITRIFLVYSAFETYCRTVGLNPSDESAIKSLQDSRSQQQVISNIRTFDPDNVVSDFLEKHLTSRHLKDLVNDFKGNKDINVSCLARCIRNVFAHGIIAANSTGLSPKRFDQVSQAIADFLLRCMDEDFDERVQSSRAKYDAVLAKVPDIEPEEHDRLPAEG